MMETRRRRVLILIKGLGRGGAEQLLLNAAPYLRNEGTDTEIAYLLTWKNALVPELEAAGVRVTCLRGDRGVSWIFRLRRLVKERSVDIVHSHSPVSAALSRIVLGRRVRHVYTEHNVWDRYHRVTRIANMLTYWRNDHVIAVSDHVKDSIRYPSLLRWVRMPMVEAIHHGVDPAAMDKWASSDGVHAELGIPESAPLVATVANFKTHKGYPYLLQAAAEIVAELPETRFVLVGLGPLEDEIKRQASDLGLGENVIFAGFREDAPRIAGAADVFAMSSLYEGLSIALLEAMALGRPVVVTRVGGLPEVVEDGTSGFVVEPKQSPALAARILALLHDPELRRTMSEGARKSAARFDISKAAKRMLETYEVLVP